MGIVWLVDIVYPGATHYPPTSYLNLYPFPKPKWWYADDAVKLTPKKKKKADDSRLQSVLKRIEVASSGSAPKNAGEEEETKKKLKDVNKKVDVLLGRMKRYNGEAAMSMKAGPGTPFGVPKKAATPPPPQPPANKWAKAGLFAKVGASVRSPAAAAPAEPAAAAPARPPPALAKGWARVSAATVVESSASGSKPGGLLGLVKMAAGKTTPPPEPAGPLRIGNPFLAKLAKSKKESRSRPGPVAEAAVGGGASAGDSSGSEGAAIERMLSHHRAGLLSEALAMPDPFPPPVLLSRSKFFSREGDSQSERSVGRVSGPVAEADEGAGEMSRQASVPRGRSVGIGELGSVPGGALGGVPGGEKTELGSPERVPSSGSSSRVLKRSSDTAAFLAAQRARLASVLGHWNGPAASDSPGDASGPSSPEVEGPVSGTVFVMPGTEPARAPSPGAENVPGAESLGPAAGLQGQRSKIPALDSPDRQASLHASPSFRKTSGASIQHMPSLGLASPSASPPSGLVGSSTLTRSQGSLIQAEPPLGSGVLHDVPSPLKPSSSLRASPETTATQRQPSAKSAILRLFSSSPPPVAALPEPPQPPVPQPPQPVAAQSSIGHTPAGAPSAASATMRPRTAPPQPVLRPPSPPRAKVRLEASKQLLIASLDVGDPPYAGAGASFWARGTSAWLEESGSEAAGGGRGAGERTRSSLGGQSLAHGRRALGTWALGGWDVPGSESEEGSGRWGVLSDPPVETLCQQTADGTSEEDFLEPLDLGSWLCRGLDPSRPFKGLLELRLQTRSEVR